MRKPTSQLRKILANDVGNYRRKDGISQEELAEACDLYRTDIGSIARCEPNVRLGTLENLAGAVHVSVPELLTARRRDSRRSKRRPQGVSGRRAIRVRRRSDRRPYTTLPGRRIRFLVGTRSAADTDGLRHRAIDVESARCRPMRHRDSLKKAAIGTAFGTP